MSFRAEHSDDPESILYTLVPFLFILLSQLIPKVTVMEKKQVQEHFAKQADSYEELMARLVPGYRQQNEVIGALLADDERTYRILDLGCGNGVLSEMVLEKLPGSYVVSFDLTNNMLEACGKKLARYTGRFELKQGDFRTEPIGSGYDIVIAGLSLHHLTWQERESFYKEIYSSLNNGGMFISRDIIIDEDETVRQWHISLWKLHMESMGEDPEFWYSKHLEKDHPVTLADHFAWLERAGFSRTACHWRLFNFAITSAEKH